MNEKNPVNSPRVKPDSLTRALATKLIMIVGSHSALQTLHHLHCSIRSDRGWYSAHWLCS